MPSHGRLSPRSAEVLPGRSFGHILGWRLWRLPNGTELPDHEGRLMSIVIHQSPWLPGEPKAAPFPPDAYGSGVNCGIYAFKTILGALGYAETILTDWTVQPFVLGEVALWGAVVEHERGYRAQYAYPYSFRALIYTSDPRSRIFETVEVQRILDLYNVRGTSRPGRIYYLPSRGGYRHG